MIVAISKGMRSASELAGWEIVRKAGAGASSVVHEAKRGDVRGALKVLERGFGLEEAAVLARVACEWGPALLDVGVTSDGRGVVVTSWVEGKSIEGAKHDEKRAWAIVHAVARGLEEIHGAGVRHGDVKPANVLWHPRDARRDVAEERSATLIDLGLAAEFGEAAKGGTAKYAAPELRSGGDVGPRADVYALGVIVRELLGDVLAEKSELGRLADAMCASAPGARPTAAWVAERAARALGLAESKEEKARARVAAVRRVYVALRAREIASASGVAESVRGAPRAWLEEAIGVARKMFGAGAGGEIAESSALVCTRWVVGLVGGTAARWPATKVDEAALAATLCALATRSPFGAWTFADLHGDGVEGVESEAVAVDDASMAIELSRAHPSARAIDEMERRGSDAPWGLRCALADALMRAGEAARAMLALRDGGGVEGDVRRAEVARRLGDAPSAGALARAALDAPNGPSGATRALRARAAAVVARIAWDAGDDERASRALASHAGPGVAEVAALVAWRRGAFDSGIRVVDESLADDADPIARARLHAARGFVEHAAGRADAALADYARAVDLAERSGAIADEATYLVGEAAAATDAGDIGRALGASTRAALLLERLGRLREASAAWLVRAAALATIGDAHGADEAAAEVIARAATDDRARAYARWARIETRAPGDASADADARAALTPFDATSDDAIRAAARALVWAPAAITETRIAELDGAATKSSPSASWDWLGARARVCASASNVTDAAGAMDVLKHILAIAQVPAPLASRGPALAAARDLAMKLGEGEAARRLETLRRAAADKLRSTTPDEYKDVLTNVAWTHDSSALDAAPESSLAPAQIAQLETIVRSLSTRDRLRPLLAASPRRDGLVGRRRTRTSSASRAGRKARSARRAKPRARRSARRAARRSR